MLQRIQFQSTRLQVRIVAVFLGLLVLVQASSFWFTQNTVDRNARMAIGQELNIGSKVFQRLIAQNSNNLTQATRVLAADYGFRSAIASGDQETVQSALENNSERINASAAVFTDADFKTKAATIGDSRPFVEAIRSFAQRNENTTQASDQVVLIQGRAYQIVAVPVRAPAVIGWVGMAFEVDERALLDMKSLSKLDLALMIRPPGQSWTTLASTRPQSEWMAVGSVGDRAPGRSASDSETEASINAKEQQSSGLQLVTDSGEFSAYALTLTHPDDPVQMRVLLLQSVDEALAPYRALKLNLLILSVLGVLAFGAGSIVTAKRITNPLRLLASKAQKLEQGDYGSKLSINSGSEIGELAQSFETMRKAIQEREGEIRRLAYEDGLTGLPNREQFRHDLRQAAAKAHDGGVACTVLLMDLDRFKHVNDVLGHRFGDRLLRAVADRLRDDVIGKEHAILARLSGDEFAILLQASDGAAALTVAQRITRAFEMPIKLDDHTVDLSAGIGMASGPEHGVEADILLARAELAMYAAKQQQAGIVSYHPGLDSNSDESLSLLSELRHAVDQKQMRVFLQPKINLLTGKVLGAEALVRWQHPTRGMVPPMSFIPFAEQTGFVRVLTMWMLKEVIQLLEELHDQGLRVKIAVNLSTRDLMDQALPDKIEAMLQQHAVDPKYLVLEITESAIMDDPERALHTLNRLHDMGLKLSIDDFGTGYSSLAYLKRLPLNELKIDRSFVMNMETDLQDAKIVYSTIELAHNLDLTVVAEGIENAQALKLLTGLGCDEAQGYFIAKPMPSSQFAAWVDSWTPPDLEGEILDSDFAALI